MNAAISILLVDDHALVREMLKERLESEADLAVVGTAPDADAAVTQALAHKPDIVLMDIDMPGMACFDAAKLIKKRCPHTRIVFLSAFSHDRYIEDALEAKATGYITKEEPPEVIIQAVRQAASGAAYFSPKVQARLIINEDSVNITGQQTPRTSLLTPRELEVLRLIAQGYTKKEIAQRLYIAPKTVEHHSGTLMAKLDIHNRVELARFAIREGLTEA